MHPPRFCRLLPGAACTVLVGAFCLVGTRRVYHRQNGGMCISVVQYFAEMVGAWALVLTYVCASQYAQQ